MQTLSCNTLLFSPPLASHRCRSPNPPQCRWSLKMQRVDAPVSDGSLSKSVVRRLILLRHARSSWDDRSLRDHDRPLSIDGRVDAITVTRKLHQMCWIPQLILSSDALRTRETLRIMQDEVQEFMEAQVHFVSSFYSIAAMDGQTAGHLQEAICKFSEDGILTVMCMGHNRGWEEAASMLSGTTIELKTCNAALLEATGKTWEEGVRQVEQLSQSTRGSPVGAASSPIFPRIPLALPSSLSPLSSRSRFQLKIRGAFDSPHFLSKSKKIQ